MGFYHIDPRLKTTDPGSKIQTGQYTTSKKWYWFAGGGNGSYGGFPDEQSAIRAAREEAGFGHVAETACDYYESFCPSVPPTHTCRHCAWPHDAHKVA